MTWCIRNKYCVLVGGAATTQEWADSINADGYGRTAGDAASLASKVISEGKKGVNK